jgi:hypothetical protein
VECRSVVSVQSSPGREYWIIKIVVPKKGLEPPHPCGYMDLNHARLPIPPLRPVDYLARQKPTLPVRRTASLFLQALARVSNFGR